MVGKLGNLPVVILMKWERHPQRTVSREREGAATVVQRGPSETSDTCGGVIQSTESIVGACCFQNNILTLLNVLPRIYNILQGLALAHTELANETQK